MSVGNTEHQPTADKEGPSRHLRIIFCDNSGMRRCRVIPMHRMKKVESTGVGLTKACMGLGVWEDAYIAESGLGCQGEIRLMPDMESKMSCPWHPGHDMVLGTMHVTPGQVWADCPRSALQRVLHQIREKHGFTFVIGQEIEFYVLSKTSSEPLFKRQLLGPVDDSLYCQTWALDNMAALMDDISDAVESLSIPVEQVHAESGPGQFEIAVSPSIGSQAADNTIYMREAIESVARRHGLVASFLPKPNPTWAGSGAHTHISLQDREGTNLMGKLLKGLEGGGSMAESFVAGILAHLPALLIFTLPSPLSYTRLQENTWSGVYRVWGVLNKEVPLRFCPGLDNSDPNLEVKCIDNTCNPYLAYAALIIAGMQGVEAKSRLPPSMQGNPTDSDSAERLPESLQEAIQSYLKDASFQHALEEALGEPLLTSFVAVRKWEAAFAEGRRDQEMVGKLLQRY